MCYKGCLVKMNEPPVVCDRPVIGGKYAKNKPKLGPGDDCI